MSKAAYPRDALHAARYWADLAYRHGDISSALDGYRVALEILPRIAWLGLSTTSRQNWLFDTYSEGLSCLAATCAIQQGHVEEAVELLDLGRSMFWQQASTTSNWSANSGSTSLNSSMSVRKDDACCQNIDRPKSRSSTASST